MSKKLNELEQPLNATERYLYAIAIRTDALCNMMSSFIETYANEKRVATTSNKVEEVVESSDVNDCTVVVGPQGPQGEPGPKGNPGPQDTQDVADKPKKVRKK